MRASGSSLVEAIAAVGVGSLLAAAGIHGVREALLALRAIGEREAALTSARNLLEAARALPCGNARAAAPCPAALRCTIRRDTLVPATATTRAVVLLQTVATPVTDPSGEPPPLTLSTAIRVPTGCN